MPNFLFGFHFSITILSAEKFMEFPLVNKNEIREQGNWRDGSVFKSFGCLYRGPDSVASTHIEANTVFNSKSRGNDHFSYHLWALHVTGSLTYKQAKHTHNVKNKYFFKKRNL